MAKRLDLKKWENIFWIEGDWSSDSDWSGWWIWEVEIQSYIQYSDTTTLYDTFVWNRKSGLW